MGTGGAGGDMSGSPAASAIETNDQTSKADVNKDSNNAVGDTSSINDTTQQKPGIKKAGSVRHKSRNL
ncbi:hypothetical protein [Segetibacter koreensis]|uniref:hypothetical protein n=1 Tax=Segetibacter koreensis TaxID=398037 RepID=UPI00036038D4|nr:hypothetical protein [Segetibacter koreensis]